MNSRHSNCVRLHVTLNAGSQKKMSIEIFVPANKVRKFVACAVKNNVKGAMQPETEPSREDKKNVCHTKFHSSEYSLQMPDKDNVNLVDSACFVTFA